MSIVIRDGEQIVKKSTRSLFAIIGIWCSLPAAVLVFVLTVVLPPIISTYKSAAKLAEIAALLGISKDELGFGDIADYLLDEVATVAIVLLAIPLVIAAIVWICACLYITFKQIGHEIVLTENRIYATNGKRTFEADFENVRNANIEISLLGKIFGYGSVTLQSKRETIVLNNIKSPKEWKRQIYNRISNNY